MLKTKNSITLLSSKCAVSNGKKIRFMKKQEAYELLSSLGLKISLGRILLLGDILFTFMK